MTQLYQPYYCEENAWQLAQSLQASHPTQHNDENTGYVALISNPTRSCALWHQRAATSPAHAVIWDYHVIVLWPQHQQLHVWDLDTYLDLPCPAMHYLQHTFAGWQQWASSFQPVFRLFSAAQYIAALSTDRSHMLDDNGNYRQPIPPWPAPYQPDKGMNLMQLVDVDNTQVPGQRLTLDAMLRWIDSQDHIQPPAPSAPG